MSRSIRVLDLSLLVLVRVVPGTQINEARQLSVTNEQRAANFCTNICIFGGLAASARTPKTSAYLQHYQRNMHLHISLHEPPTSDATRVCPDTLLEEPRGPAQQSECSPVFRRQVSSIFRPHFFLLKSKRKSINGHHHDVTALR